MKLPPVFGEVRQLPDGEFQVDLRLRPYSLVLIPVPPCALASCPSPLAKSRISTD